MDLTREPSGMNPSERAHLIRDRIPSDGLFFGHEWRISPDPFPISAEVAKEFETLGRVLLQFYRAVNLLYRQSVAGKQPAWVAAYLDAGKPGELLGWQRSHALKNELPRVIRPDVLLTDSGLIITELDSIPGGIGLTAWLNLTYSFFSPKSNSPSVAELRRLKIQNAKSESSSGGPNSLAPSPQILGGA